MEPYNSCYSLQRGRMYTNTMHVRAVSTQILSTCKLVLHKYNARAKCFYINTIYVKIVSAQIQCVCKLFLHKYYSRKICFYTKPSMSRENCFYTNIMHVQIISKQTDLFTCKLFLYTFVHAPTVSTQLVFTCKFFPHKYCARGKCSYTNIAHEKIVLYTFIHVTTVSTDFSNYVQTVSTQIQFT